MLQAKRHWIMSVVQPLTIAFSLLLSWLLRFDFTLPHLTLLLFAGVVLVGVRAAAMYQFQLTHGFWRFTGVSDLKDLGTHIFCADSHRTGVEGVPLFDLRP
jgi:FlaA1/EpsC-like NDP-sugar epimerase